MTPQVLSKMPLLSTGWKPGCMWYTMWNVVKGAGLVAVAVCHEVEHLVVQDRL